MQIALFATLMRPHALDIVRQTASWLLAREQTVRMAPALARAIDCGPCAVPEEQVIAGADLALAIGGDGTVLGAVRAAAPARVPVLGMNAGALGFLTELSPTQMTTYLPRVLAGDYTLEPRMMLRARAYRGDALLREDIALNDVVVRQGAKGRLVTLELAIAGYHLGRMSADGLILSTPTGSTAYGMAAGGPIIHPIAQVMVMVPICPHSFSFRPMVIPATDPMEIRCESNQHGDEMMLSVDGQQPETLFAGDRVIIQPAAEQALLVKLGLSPFYDRLREKLQWGGG